MKNSATAHLKDKVMFPQLLLLVFIFSCKKETSILNSDQLDSNLKAVIKKTATSTATSDATVTAVKYYVDPSSTSPIEDGSINAPWKTLKQVNNNMDRFNPGDKIYFKRGQHFKGSLIIYRSGTSSAPITFTSYGSGDAPVIEYDINTTKAVTDRIIIDLVKAQYIVLNGFNLTDRGMNMNDRNTNARVGTGINIGHGSHNIIKNMQLSLLGMGIEVKGDYNTITHCSFDNMRMIVNDNSKYDYGAIGLELRGSNNKIYSNIFSNNWAYSYYDGINGGAIEFYGPHNNNKIMYNKAINNDGFIEFGSGAGGSAINNLLAYNLLINNGKILFISTAGTFALSVTNFQFYNNTVVETTQQHKKYTYLIGASLNSPQPEKMFIMKNNILWVNTPVTVVRNLSSSSFIHTNNIYRLSAGIPGFNLSTTENSISTTIPLFANTVSTNPLNWNYSPASSSAAVDRGVNLGFTVDFNKRPVFNGLAPDAGAFESANTR